jgi:hypothetical protein
MRRELGIISNNSTTEVAHCFQYRTSGCWRRRPFCLTVNALAKEAVCQQDQFASPLQTYGPRIMPKAVS